MICTVPELLLGACFSANDNLAITEMEVRLVWSEDSRPSGPEDCDHYSTFFSLSAALRQRRVAVVQPEKQ